MTYQINHFIAGKQTVSPGPHSHAIHNPATGHVIGSVSFANHETVLQAVQAAREAYPSWSATPPLKRARVLFKFKELLEKHTEELAALVNAEHGKTLDDARGSVARGIELVEFACGIPAALKGSYSENVGTDIDCYTVRQSLGVCVGISPFNFPVMVPIWMFVSAIACGNTFVLKPSEKDPSAPMLLAKLLHDAGLPAGVFNVVHGDKSVVDTLITHPDVVAVSAVASSAVAQSIYLTATAHGKRAHTFGGAKNHCVVMPDVDMEQTAQAIVGAAYGSAGERCMAIPVVVAVGEKTGDDLIAQLKPLVEKLAIGPGNQKGIDMGPLISCQHRDHVKTYIDLGVKEGATLVVDGRDFVCAAEPNGFYLGGSLFDHVTAEMKIYQDEIFGPVLVVVRVADLDSAIALVSAHQYGNGAAIFTQSGDWARAFATQAQAGMVGINVPIPVPVAYHSFGGWKRSFFGDIGMHGDQSVAFFTRLKTVTSRWPRVEHRADFVMPNIK